MAKQEPRANEKEKKITDFFETEHDLDLREYVRWKRSHPGGDRSLSLDPHEHFSKLSIVVICVDYF